MNPYDPQTESDLYDAYERAAAEPTNDPMPDEPVTELGYANRLVDLYGNQIRYIPAWRKWLIWDTTRWKVDTTGQVARWMKVVARRVTTDALAIMDDQKRRAAINLARRGESSAGIAGALTLASTVAGIAVDHEMLDADPFLVNCANGTLDLRTGELRDHDPKDLLTKQTRAAYRVGSAGAEFDRFLCRVQPDPAMREFLARLIGHTLEGRVVEHVLPIFYGSGANGKSTLVNAVVHALGDYADAADPDLLTARTFDAHPTGVADLFGLRLALLHEGDAGRRLAEGTMKRLTGGDRVKARRMREDFWAFEPSHSFVMLTNHKPLVAGTDEGTWRRVRLVPWDVVVPLADRDEHLGEKLALEADAVLAWLVNGYIRWRARGLEAPQAVQDATAAYRAESDTLGRFLTEKCMVGPTFRVRSSHLHEAYTTWCTREGEEAASNKAFSTELQNRGFDIEKTRDANVWKGIGLKTEDSL